MIQDKKKLFELQWFNDDIILAALLDSYWVMLLWCLGESVGRSL